MIVPRIRWRDKTNIQIIQVLFLFKAVVWLGFGAAHLALFQTPTAVVLAGLMFIDAAIFFGLGLVLPKRNRWIYWLAVAFLAVNIILTITDEFGIFDFLVLVVDALVLFLLVLHRKELTVDKAGR